MRPRDWRVRIEDMLQAIEYIEKFAAGLDSESFQASPIARFAVISNLAIIGEAANHLPEEVRQLRPDIPWRDVRDMRNLIVHQYFEVDVSIIWQTIQDDLPLLKDALLDILGREP